MKKFLIFILTFAYLASTSGATIYIQQCMGRIISCSLVEKDSNKCSKCGMHKNASNDCCKGHVKVLKVHSDQNLPEIYFNKISLANAMVPETTFHFNEWYSSNTQTTIPENIPPPGQKDLCIFCCTFLI